MRDHRHEEHETALERAIRLHVEAAPPLTEATREELARLLAGDN